jgi:hypothetical protein
MKYWHVITLANNKAIKQVYQAWWFDWYRRKYMVKRHMLLFTVPVL